MESNDQSPAWWEEEGPDICERCETAYYAEDGYYCSHCDCGICVRCVTFSQRGRVLCGYCHNEQPKQQQGESQ